MVSKLEHNQKFLNKSKEKETKLQEALRSLEEYGKLRDPQVAAALEQLRYRSYTLEKALALGDDARRRLAGAVLYSFTRRRAG